MHIRSVLSLAGPRSLNPNLNIQTSDDSPPSYQAALAHSFEPISETTVLLSLEDVDHHRNIRARPRPTYAVLATLGILLLVLSIAQNLCLLPILMDDVPAVEKAAQRRAWQAERTTHERLSQQWAQERSLYEQDARMWEEERAKWREERNREQQHRKDVECMRRGIYWTEPVGDKQCSAYATRVYRASLKSNGSQIDLGPNWLELCSDMPVSIHGIRIGKPDRCERDARGEIVGIWSVDFDEPSCVPYWGSISREGCAPGRPGMARATARLWGLQSGDSWERMCGTTPATVSGHAFDHPTSCENRGMSGMVGMWDYPEWGC